MGMGLGPRAWPRPSGQGSGPGSLWATRAGAAWSAQFGGGDGGGQPGYLDPPMSPLLVLIVAVLATTYAGPIVRFAMAPALAIAFWRLALVLPVVGVLAAREGSGERGAVPSARSEGTAPRS